MTCSGSLPMRLLRTGALLMGLLPVPEAHSQRARAIDLTGYQGADGAITVHRQGDIVDPYFAMKALWASRKLGHGTNEETRKWIAWLLPRQRLDGGFSRFCNRAAPDSNPQANGAARPARQQPQWHVCADADADDSTLALWIALLHQAAPEGLPPRWAASAQRAQQALQALRHPGSGVYRVHADVPTALLMDNCEVYEALHQVGQIHQQAGRRAQAHWHLQAAESLRAAMARVFPVQPGGLLRWSNESPDLPEQFYPHQVAHLYPWLHQVPTDGFGPMLDWSGWRKRYANPWLQRSGDAFAWGLVALLAWQKVPRAMVAQWVEQAAGLRAGPYWNVLDEVLLQGLALPRRRAR